MTRLHLRALLPFVIVALACGDAASPSNEDGGSGPQTDAGVGDGVGDGDGDGDGEIVDAGGGSYPGFVPKRCAGIGCPEGPCGEVLGPECTALYSEVFDAHYDYCAVDPSAAYCVGSVPVDTSPSTPEGEAYCVNCENGEPAIERCRSAAISTGSRPAVCL
jgi:hypothetical protein